MRKNYILLILGIVVLSTFVSALFVRMNSLNQTRDDGITRKTLSYPVMVGVVTNVEKTSKILCEWNLTLNVTGDFYKQHLGSRIFYVSDLYLMMQNARDFDMAGVKGSGIAINYVADGFGDILNYRNFFFFKQSDLPFYNRWANFEGQTLDIAEGTVGTRGLTTIPVAIQKALGLRKGDKIVYSVTNQHVEVRKKTT